MAATEITRRSGGRTTSIGSTELPFPHPRVRPAWLAGLREDIIDPGQQIIDPHHHLWHARPDRYLLDDLAEDLGSGHDVRATVFIQCGSAYRKDGPDELRPVGETEFVSGVATASETRNFQACAGVVGHADCRLGDRIEPVLLAHVAAGGGRFKGIRHGATYDAGIAPTAPPGAPPGLLLDPAFRAGVARAGALRVDLRGTSVTIRNCPNWRICCAPIRIRKSSSIIWAAHSVSARMRAVVPRFFPNGQPASGNWPKAPTSASNWAAWP